MDLNKLKQLESLNELSLTEAEEEKMLGIYSFMAEKEDSLKEINTADSEPAVYVMPIMNVLREDIADQPFSRESLLEGGAQRTEDSWQVPRLVK